MIQQRSWFIGILLFNCEGTMLRSNNGNYETSSLLPKKKALNYEETSVVLADGVSAVNSATAEDGERFCCPTMKDLRTAWQPPTMKFLRFRRRKKLSTMKKLRLPLRTEKML